MTFADIKRRVLSGTQLNPNLFGERVTFLLHDGTPVAASVHIKSERKQDDDEATADRTERLLVLVNRDPERATALDANDDAIGSIENPQPGLRMVRPLSHDARPYSFTGEIMEERDHKWRLVFERTRRIRQGIRP